MRNFIIIQIIIDMAFFSVLIYLIIRTNSLGKLENIITKSKDEFKKLIEEAKRWSDKFISELSLNEKKSKELIEKMEKTYKKLLEEEKKLHVNNPDFEKTKKVLLLFNQGLSVEEISKGLEIPEGEVKLILDLINYSKKNKKL